MGRSPGHEGHKRELSADFDAVIDHRPTGCPDCGLSLSSDLPAEVVSVHEEIDFTDYDVMAAAGAQASVGHLERAYDYQWMVRAAPSMGVPTGHWSPYTYPPTAALGSRILASVPDVAGLLLLQALGLALFSTGIARLSGGVPRLWLVASGVPIACFNLRSGQNGLVTAGLAAHAAALYADRRSVRAGILAALATFTPHLALGLPTLLAARREGRGLLAFIVVSVGLVALSVAEFGVEAWTAFGQATAFAARNLAEGTYPLARFSSTYARRLRPRPERVPGHGRPLGRPPFCDARSRHGPSEVWRPSPLRRSGAPVGDVRQPLRL